jgi:4-oxalocrotonate tautomerase
MPRVRIEWLSTRTEEQRRVLAKKITRALEETVGVKPDDVTVVFEEIAPHLMAKGGTLCSEQLNDKKHPEKAGVALSRP